MKIKNKILAAFLSLTLISVISVSTLDFFSARGALLLTITKQLEALVKLKADRIRVFFDTLEDSVSIAQDYYNIKTNLPIVTRFSKDRTHPDYIKAKDMLDGQLRKWLKTREEVSGIMLVSLEGNIVYSADEERAKSDLDKALPDPGGTAFAEGKKGIFISNIFRSPDDSPRYRFGLVVAAPVFDFDNRLIGVVAFEINMDPIYRFIQDTTGLGKTGRTLVVRKEGDRVLFLNPLRHDQGAALEKKVYFGDKAAVPAQEAAKGREGSGIVKDYRNEEVLSAWNYVPNLGWGVIAKIDLREALAPVIALRNRVVVFCFVVFILAVAVSLVIAESVSRPIRMLHQGAEIIGTGNLDHRVGKDTKDEIGQLSRAFDRMAEHLKAAQHKLVRSEKLSIVGKLASSVAHELRNPLGVMKNAIYYLNMLESVKSNPEFKENLDIIDQEIESSVKIITDLLEFSRSKKPVRRPENINLIVREILDRMTMPPNVELTLELEDGLPKIGVDALQMHQVFYNIAKNAVESMARGGKLKIRTGLKDDSSMEISFSDTGPGISKEDIAHIFEPLFSTKTKGTGLGLSVCSSIIERHGGKIEVDSEAGKGTVFTVRLPIKKG